MLSTVIWGVPPNDASATQLLLYDLTSSGPLKEIVSDVVGPAGMSPQAAGPNVPEVHETVAPNSGPPNNATKRTDVTMLPVLISVPFQ
jgi:hypothetical protein